ncbi:hypothetical protein SNE40_021037 [Patella caerulea]|uniref:COMM domain-containing protein 6 n=1 Tax=Patella caerulea TaxID=87958 RepID=A0AAN8GJM1_PATCE
MADSANLLFPQGFTESLCFCEDISEELLLKICYDVLDFQQMKLESLPYDSYQNDVREMYSKDRIENIVRAISFIYRTATQSKETDNELRSRLLSLSVLSNNKINIILQGWQKEGKQLLLTDSAMKDINVGKLLDIKWKIGMSVSSSECKQLNSSFVSMVIIVADQSGKAKHHSLEMTLKQFRNFSNQLKEMAKLIDAV